MKDFYKIVLFLAMFQMAALMIAGIDVFPEGTTLYSDLSDLQTYADSPVDMLSYIFLPDTLGPYRLPGGAFTLTAIIGFIIGGGALASIATHSYAPAILAILGVSFVPMVTKSLTFFRRLFQFDGVAVVYTAIALGVLLLFVYMILETPNHGRS